MNLSVTPGEVRSAIEELNALSLHTVSNEVPKDNALLMLARMTEPIMSMALDMYDIMAKNEECIAIFQGRMTGDDVFDAGDSLHEELLLHRQDMTTYIVENKLWIEFGCVEGSLRAREVACYSRRFEGYRAFIRDLRVGYIALAKEIKQKEQCFAMAYMDCCNSMDFVASSLVDDFLLRFADPEDSVKSDIGQGILRELGGDHVLRLKLDRLQRYVESEHVVAART